MVTGVFSIPLPGQTLRLINDSKPHDPRSRRLKQFIAGDENKVVCSAIQSVLQSKKPQYNPLIFFGPSGTGKSHLALGFANYFSTANPKASVVSFPVIDFARNCFTDNDLTSTEQVDERINKYHNTDLLVIDDLHQLPENPTAQYKLIHLIDHLIKREVQIIITTRLNPTRIAHLIAPLRSRLSMGLSIMVAKPGEAARLAIIRELAATRAIVIGPQAAALLASGYVATVPEILGALIELEFSAIQNNNTISSEQVEFFLKSKQQSHPTLQEITTLVAKHLGVKMTAIKGSSRQKSLVIARSIIIYLARELTELSLQRIGSFLGNRDHTTILHNYRKIQHELKENQSLLKSVQEINNKLVNVNQ